MRQPIRNIIACPAIPKGSGSRRLPRFLGSLGFAACYHRDARNPALERAEGFGEKVEAHSYEEGVGVDGGIHPMIGGTDGAARGELSSLITYGTDFGTRDMGQKLREKLLPLINGQEKVVLDFTGVNVVSNSFADECIAKLLLEMPLAELKRRTTFRGLNPLAERSILVALQRRYKVLSAD